MFLLLSRIILFLFIVILCSDVYGQDIKQDYYENGQIKNEYSVDKDGNPHGLVKTYCEDGSLLSVKRFVNGLPDGESIWYYKTGTIRTIQNYKLGKQDGIEENYAENKGMTGKSEWKEGKILWTQGRDEKSGELLHTTEYEPDKSCTTIIYSNGKITSRTMYDSDNKIMVIISYNEYQNIINVKFMEIDMRPSKQDLLAYLDIKESDLDYESLVESSIIKFLNFSEKRTDASYDNEHSIIMFQKGLLPHLVKKAELAQSNSNDIINQESLIKILSEYFYSINIEITKIDLEDLVIQYKANIKTFNDALVDETSYMGYKETEKDIELAKKNFLKFRKLYELSNTEFTQQDLFEFIDSGFIEDYLRRAKQIKAPDKRNKKIQQIQYVLENIYLTNNKLSKVQRSNIESLLKNIDKTIDDSLKIDTTKLIEILKEYTGTKENNYQIATLIDLSIAKIVNDYCRTGMLDKKTIKLLYDENGIYKYIRMFSERNLDTLLLSGLFMYIMNDAIDHDLLSLNNIDSIFGDFHQYTNLYQIDPKENSILQDFREFRSIVQGMDTRKLRWHLR